MKKKAYHLGLYSILLITTLIVCFKTSQNSVHKIRYSGIDLFKGIFFQEGNAAGEISEFSCLQHTKQNGAGLDILHKQLIFGLAKADVHFFENFKRDIQSGDPVTIESRLIKSQEAVTKQLKNISNSQPSGRAQINTSSIGAEEAPYPGGNPAVIVVNPPPVTEVALIKSINENNALVIVPHSLQTEALVFSIAKNF